MATRTRPGETGVPILPDALRPARRGADPQIPGPRWTPAVLRWGTSHPAFRAPLGGPGRSGPAPASHSALPAAPSRYVLPVSASALPRTPDARAGVLAPCGGPPATRHARSAASLLDARPRCVPPTGSANGANARRGVHGGVGAVRSRRRGRPLPMPWGASCVSPWVWAKAKSPGGERVIGPVGDRVEHTARCPRDPVGNRPWRFGLRAYWVASRRGRAGGATPRVLVEVGRRRAPARRCAGRPSPPGTRGARRPTSDFDVVAESFIDLADALGV